MFELLRRRLRALIRRNELERDLDDEMRFHLEKEIEHNIARGMSEREARTAALRSFGGVEQFKEEARDVRGVRMLEELGQDVRYGLRMMRKTPGFTAVAVLSLALGIGANTALFSVVDSVLLRRLPVKEPDRLVLFEWEAGKAFRTGGTSGYSAGPPPPGRRGSSSFNYRVFEAMRAEQSALADAFAFADLWQATVSVDGQPEIADGQYVTGRYFAALGVPALVGRTLVETDDDAAAPPAAVISYAYWQSHFGGDPDVVGKQIVVNKVPFTVVGVTPREFRGTLQVDMNPAVTVPMAFEPTLEGKNSMMVEQEDGRAVWWVHVMGRLKPGATVEQARESLNGTFQSVGLSIMPPPKKENETAEIDPKDYPNLVARSGSQGMMETRKIYSSTIYILVGVVGLVLLIACANVANLLLARSTARGSEITLRLALGAGRLRLVRQLLTESVLLAALGGMMGVLFALWGTSALSAMSSTDGGLLPSGIDYGLSWRVLGFTTAISLLTGVLFGLAPALRATRLDLTTALNEGKRGSSGVSRSRLSKALVVAQVSMSLLLLVGAGLFVRTVRNLQYVDLGFNEENLLLFSVRPGSAGYTVDRREELYRHLFARFEAIPGVRAVTFLRVPLLSHMINSSNLILPGETAESSAEHGTNRQIVRENYFDTMEIPLLSGRGFTEQDREGAPKVAIVSEALAQKFFPDQDPIGQRVGFDSKTLGQLEIVGVARDTKYSSQRDEIEPLIYTPWLQETDNLSRMSFVLRSGGDPMVLAAAVRQAVHETAPDLPIDNLTTQAARSSDAFTQERTFASLLSFFGALALLLAAIGLYGVMAYSVAQRTNEIGIRMALGAQVAGVLRLIIWQGLKFVLVGLVVGALAALALKRVVESQLYGVEGTDPLTFAVVGTSLVAVALVACLIPARRAAKVDPVVALRSE